MDTEPDRRSDILTPAQCFQDIEIVFMSNAPPASIQTCELRGRKHPPARRLQTCTRWLTLSSLLWWGVLEPDACDGSVPALLRACLCAEGGWRGRSISDEPVENARERREGTGATRLLLWRNRISLAGEAAIRIPVVSQAQFQNLF